MKKLPRQKTQRWEENMLIAISEKKRSSLAKWSEAHHEHANVSKSQEEKSFQLLVIASINQNFVYEYYCLGEPYGKLLWSSS